MPMATSAAEFVKTCSSDDMSTDLDDIRWQTVLDRRHEARGLFVMGVRTTGIFCRPGCPARTPKRENVEFFPDVPEAVAAGYRACLRCRPDDDPSGDESVAAVIDVCRRLEKDAASSDIDALSAAVGWSPRHLARMFKRTTGVTIAAYARAQRGERARTALRSGASVTDAVYEAGYGSSRAFYEHGASRLGGSPDSYRRGSPDTTIGYALCETALGRVLIGQTDRGVCCVRIGEDDDRLVAELQDEFPAATVIPGGPELDAAIAAVAEVAEGRGLPSPDLPLDLRGTAFQVAVWEALRTIEPGGRRTYGDVARQIGKPASHRAVANACGANPVALLVPCHRVVRGDGRTGGYRWGEERKAKLLESEATSRASE